MNGGWMRAPKRELSSPANMYPLYYSSSSFLLSPIAPAVDRLLWLRRPLPPPPPPFLTEPATAPPNRCRTVFSSPRRWPPPNACPPRPASGTPAPLRPSPANPPPPPGRHHTRPPPLWPVDMEPPPPPAIRNLRPLPPATIPSAGDLTGGRFAHLSPCLAAPPPPPSPSARLKTGRGSSTHASYKKFGSTCCCAFNL